MPQDTPACLQSNFIYSTCSWHLVFNVTSPPSAAGVVGFSPMFGGAPLHGPGPNGEGTLHLRLLVPNSKEGDKGIAGNTGNYQGCYVGNTPSADFFTADDGTPFAGNALVLFAGGCPYNMKQKLAKYLNASIVMIAENGYFYNMREFADDPYVARAGVLANVEHGYLTSLVLSKDDGTTLVNLIASNNFSTPVNISIVGSGKIAPEDKSFMVNISHTLTFRNMAIPGITVGSLRDWSDMANPALDICYDGIVGVWCENGKVVNLVILPAYQTFTGYIDEGVFEQMTAVRYISWPQNTGPVFRFPENWCENAESMQLVQFRALDSFSSYPDCWDRLPNLIMWSVQGGSHLASLPMSVFRSKTIALLYITAVPLNQTLPSSLQPMTELSHLTLNFNSQIANIFPNITGLTKLQGLNLDLTDFSSGSVSSSFLNGFPRLRTLSMQNCKIRGPLPDFVNSQQYLTDIALNGNSFTGGIPISWDTDTFMPGLTNLQLHHNQLSQSPREFLFGALKFATQLTKIDLSYNLINYYDGDENHWTYNVFTFLALILPRSETGLKILDLSYNNFTGYTGDNLFQTGAVEEIYLSHNHIRCLPSIFFYTNIPTWDFSYNELEGSCDDKSETPTHHVVPGIPNEYVPYNFFKYLNLQGNPQFRSSAMSVNYGLPSYLVPQFDVLSERQGDTYLCGYSIGDPVTYKNMKVLLDPEFNNYQLCSCQPGTYGAAPHCEFLPDAINVNGSAKSIVSANMAENAFNSVNNLVSDVQYGNQRLITGMNSIFVFKSDNHAVLVTNLLIYVNLDAFVHDTDVISVYQGEQVDGVLLFSIFGNSAAQLRASVNATQIRPYVNTGVFFVQVPRKEATIRYSSRQTQGSLFSVDHSFSADCPSSSYYLSNQTGFCEKLMPCTYSDYTAVYGSCSFSSTTMRVTYVLKDGVICLQTNTSVPASQTVSCASIPASSSILGVLIALGAMVGLLAFQPLLSQIAQQCCRCCGSAVIDKKKKKEAYGMEVFNGVWNVFLTASWILQITTAASNFGDVETWKCNLRIYTIVLGMFSSQGALFIGGRVISNLMSLQLMNLKAFSIRSSIILFGVLFLAASALIVMTTTSGDMLSSVNASLNSEQILDQQVCSLGSALYFFAPLATLSVLLTVINLFQLVPPLLNITRKFANRVDNKLNKLQQQHRWAELILLSLLSIVNFASYLVVTATTYFGSYLQNNSMITKIQFAIYLSNVVISILLRYVIPYFVVARRSSTANKGNSTMNINFSSVLEAEANEPMVQVLDNSFYRWCLGNYLKENEVYAMPAFETTNQLLNILSNIEYESFHEILIITPSLVNNNNQNVEMPAKWFRDLSDMFENQRPLPFSDTLLAQFSNEINDKIDLQSGKISLRAFNKALYPIAKRLFDQLQPAWEGFSTSADFVKPNAVSKWSNFFLNLNSDEQAHVIELLQSYCVD